MLENGQESPGNLARSAPPLWNINFIFVCLSSFSVYLAFYSLIVCLPVYIKEQGGSTGSAGLALAVLTVAAVIIRPFTGFALDLYGRRAILIGGLLLFLLPSVAFIGMMQVSMLLILRFVQGFGWGICATASGTVASDVVPKSRLGEGLGYFSLTSSFSAAIAPVIGLWLIDAFSFRTMFAVCFLFSLISLGLALVIKYPKLEIHSKDHKLVFIEKLALRPALVALLVAVTFSSLQSFLVLYARQQGLNSAGIFFTAFALTTLLSRPLSGLVVDRMGMRGYDLVMLTGTPAIVAAMLVVSRTASLWHLVTGGVLFGLGYGLIQSTMLVLAVNLVPGSRRGAANATFWTAFDTGVAVGSVLWGVVANWFGYPVLFALAVIPVVLALGLYFFMAERYMPVINEKLPT